ncbi:MAG: TetR/AcrR family transcriptional regulator [Clostridia bacterium]|nr:TetR/AcrR family transcriptional regulator [Clostridia bacterium]
MKKGDARRGELLAAAERLFYTKGYEQTSVQDILDEIGFSKGGFYHHFDSKLSVLEAICDLRAQESCERAKQIVAQEADAAQKLNALLHSSALWQSENSSFVSLLIQVAYRHDSALMRERMKSCQLRSLQETMEAVLEQGAQSGEFFVTDIQATASLLLRLYMQFTDEVAFLLARQDNADLMMEEIIRRMGVYRAAIERTLIAPFGSIVLFEAKEMQLLVSGVLKSRIRQRADEKLGLG